MKFINKMLIPAAGFFLAGLFVPKIAEAPTLEFYNGELDNIEESSSLKFDITDEFGNEFFEEINRRIMGQYEFAEPSYAEFPFPDEIKDIFKYSEMKGVDPFLIMAIRIAEDGDPGVEYGIKPPYPLSEEYKKNKGFTISSGEYLLYENNLEKQMIWCIGTVKANMERFSKNSKNHNDFISYLASVYAPIGAKNDPTNLNKHWEENVRKNYEMLTNS